jgi:hypothetical protein
MRRCGADQREITRWSRGTDLAGHELNFNTEFEYLRDWWTRHIAYLDRNVFIPYPAGDINFDRDVNVTDVTALISYLLGPRQRTINTYQADYNKDGDINISDIVGIINVLLQQ